MLVPWTALLGKTLLELDTASAIKGSTHGSCHGAADGSAHCPTDCTAYGSADGATHCYVRDVDDGVHPDFLLMVRRGRKNPAPRNLRPLWDRYDERQLGHVRRAVLLPFKGVSFNTKALQINVLELIANCAKSIAVVRRAVYEGEEGVSCKIVQVARSVRADHAQPACRRQAIGSGEVLGHMTLIVESCRDRGIGDGETRTHQDADMIQAAHGQVTVGAGAI